MPLAPVIILEIVLILNIVLLLIILFRLLDMRQVRGTKYFIVIIISMLLISLFYILEIASDNYDMKLFWIKVKNIPFSFLGPFVLLFSLNYLYKEPKLPKLLVTLLFLEPLLYLLILFLDPFGGRLALGGTVMKEGVFDTIHFESFEFYLIHLAYQAFLVITAVVYLISRGVKEERRFRTQYIMLSAALLIPLIFAIGENFIVIPGMRIDWPVFSFSLSVIMIYLGLFSYGMFRITPIPSKTVLDSLDEGVIIIDRNQMIQDLNIKAENFTGRSRSKVVSRRFSDVLSEYTDLLDMETGKDSKSRLLVDEEKERTYFVSSYRVSDRREGYIGTLLIIKDVTEEEMAKERIERYGSLMSMINKVLRHDLLNDLWIMQVSIQKGLESQNDGLIENALLSIEKSKETIKRMKMLERESLRQEPLKRFRISRILEKLDAHQDLDISLEGDSVVMADNGIFTIFNNLFSNAVKHGGASRLSVKILKNGSSVTVDVHDNGKGIPFGIRDSIFDEGITFGEAKGSGLGLHIVKRSMDRIGGTIGLIDGKDGEGACFRLTFQGSH